MASLNDKLKSRSEFHILHKNALDAELEQTGSDGSNTFWHQARLLTRNIASRYAQTGRTHPIELYEYDLRELWYMCVQGARLIAAEHPTQDRLVSQVLHTREMGVLSRKSGDAKEEGKRDDHELEIASTSDGNIWSDLPFLVEEIRAAWTLSPSIPTVQRHNLSAFIARLASVGVRDPELCLVAIWILRDTLETPRPLTSGAKAPSHDSKQRLTTIADLLPAAIVWFQYCGHKIESLCILNQDFESGFSETGELAQKAQIMPDSGFSVARWIFWRDRFEEISRCGNEEVAPLALKAWKTMKFWGERIESRDGTK
ncbi:hypothetical protein BCON_0002g01000 [Botryotinia convoluta]|uniref:Uncharacterized protein n=1 Tax=Botryotinia convoluta TaxID=54673 RepID=A0A4Z1IVY4_9HELO|nr:hypothetical protein BCON_0002g01000 [Botryotinia convoluta]